MIYIYSHTIKTFDIEYTYDNLNNQAQNITNNIIIIKTMLYCTLIDILQGFFPFLDSQAHISSM